MNSEYQFNNNLNNNYSKISIETTISPSINTLSPISNAISNKLRVNKYYHFYIVE